MLLKSESEYFTESAYLLGAIDCDLSHWPWGFIQGEFENDLYLASLNNACRSIRRLQVCIESCNTLRTHPFHQLNLSHLQDVIGLPHKPSISKSELTKQFGPDISACRELIQISHSYVENRLRLLRDTAATRNPFVLTAVDWINNPWILLTEIELIGKAWFGMLDSNDGDVFPLLGEAHGMLGQFLRVAPLAIRQGCDLLDTHDVDFLRGRFDDFLNFTSSDEQLKDAGAINDRLRFMRLSASDRIDMSHGIAPATHRWLDSLSIDGTKLRRVEDKYSHLEVELTQSQFETFTVLHKAGEMGMSKIAFELEIPGTNSKRSSRLNDLRNTLFPLDITIPRADYRLADRQSDHPDQ
jgi:hypothetical protein